MVHSLNSVRDLSLVGNTRLNRQFNHRAFYEEPTDPPTPPAEKTYTAEEVQELQAQIDALTQDKTKLSGVVDNLRPFEKQFKTVAAILGDTAPEKLQEYVSAEEKARTIQDQQDQNILLAKQEVKSEYQKLLDEANTKAQQASNQLTAQKKQYDMFQSFNAKGGVSEEFSTFGALASENVQYNAKGAIEIRDDAGNLLTYKPADPKEDERQASLDDFMVMIADGQIDKFQFRHSSGLKRCMKAYNESSGAGLPGGKSGGKEGWKNLEGDQLWQAAFSS